MCKEGENFLLAYNFGILNSFKNLKIWFETVLTKSTSNQLELSVSTGKISKVVNEVRRLDKNLLRLV